MDNTLLREYRSHLLAHMLKVVDEFCSACQAVKDKSLPIDGGLNCHQVASHTRDVEIQVYGRRVRRTGTENSPTFTAFDQEAWSKENYRAEEALDDILNELRGSVQELVNWLQTQPDETWSRPSRHEIHGERTLQTWVERGLAHLEEHLEIVNKAIKN